VIDVGKDKPVEKMMDRQKGLSNEKSPWRKEAEEKVETFSGVLMFIRDADAYNMAGRQ
jgi:hypothetical protein